MVEIGIGGNNISLSLSLSLQKPTPRERYHARHGKHGTSENVSAMDTRAAISRGGGTRALCEQAQYAFGNTLEHNSRSRANIVGAQSESPDPDADDVDRAPVTDIAQDRMCRK